MEEKPTQEMNKESALAILDRARAAIGDAVSEPLAMLLRALDRRCERETIRMSGQYIKIPPCRFAIVTEEPWHKDRPCQGKKVQCGCPENEIDVVAQQSCHPTRCRFYEVEAPE